MKKAKAYLLDDTTRCPLVIHAVSGAGKTAIMAMIMKSIPSWIGNHPHTKIIRFLGTTPNTSNVYDVLMGLLNQLADVHGKVIPPVNCKTMASLTEYAPKFLRQLGCKAKIPIVILLDSVDQLGPKFDAYAMRWLPLVLPPNVKIIISTLPENHNILKNLKKLMPTSQHFIEVPPLSENAGKDIIGALLAIRERKLTDWQMELVMSAFKTAPIPLFLKLLIDEARLWNSYTQLGDIFLPSTVKESINKLFEKLEKKFGKTLVAHALGYLTIGMAGVTQFELEDVLSCDDVVLNDVYKYHDPPVPGQVRIPSVLWARIQHDIKSYIVERQSLGRTTLNWYHRQFVETAAERYTSDGKDVALHKNLTDVFAQENGIRRTIKLKNRNNLEIVDADRQVNPQPLSVDNKRKLACLPYHACMALSVLGSNFVKSNILCNFRFLCKRMAAFSKATALMDMDEFLEKDSDAEVKYLRDFISSANGNITHPLKFAFEILSILNPSPEEKCLKQLVGDAERYLRAQKAPLLVPRFPWMATRDDASSAMLAQVNNVKEVLGQYGNELLLKLEPGMEDEERPEFEIFSIDSQESVPVDMKSEGVNGGIHIRDECVYYVTKKKLVIMNWRTGKVSKFPFSSFVKDWKAETEIQKDVVFEKTNSHIALVFESCILMFSLEDKQFVRKLVAKASQFELETCYFLPDEQLLAMGYMNSKDQTEAKSFACKFRTEDVSSDCIFTVDGRTNFKQTAFACQDQTFAFATKGKLKDQSDTAQENDNAPSSTITILSIDKMCALKSYDMLGNVVEIWGNPDMTSFIILNSSGSVFQMNQAYELQVEIAHPVTSVLPLWNRNVWILRFGCGYINIYDSKNNNLLGGVPAFTVPIKCASVTDEVCLTLGENSELKVWSIGGLVEHVKHKKDKTLSDFLPSTLLDLSSVTSLAVSTDGKKVYTCQSDSTLRFWDLDTLYEAKKLTMDITGHVTHALPNCIAVHDNLLGKVKVFDLAGNMLFEPLKDGDLNTMCSVVGADKKKMYLVGSKSENTKKRSLQIDVFSMETFQHVASTKIQQQFSYEGFDIKLTENDRFLVIRANISEAEVESMKPLWKQVNLEPQVSRYKFYAVDLAQSNGSLIPCHRMLKIPLLGVAYAPIGPSSVVITSRR